MHAVAPGECVSLHTLSLHHDERLFPNPKRCAIPALLLMNCFLQIFYRWDPTRFEQEEEIDTYAFVGWGAGRHRCTGQKISEMIMKLVIIFVLTQYPDCSLELEDGTPIESEKQIPEIRKDNIR